jgi:hypothetical protein
MSKEEFAVDENQKSDLEVDVDNVDGGQNDQDTVCFFTWVEKIASTKDKPGGFEYRIAELSMNDAEIAFAKIDEIHALEEHKKQLERHLGIVES